jgi:2-polyprenyl-3-methyl-5-hydroxy-6-metoxy-1,4-benzoquinol methylase
MALNPTKKFYDDLSADYHLNFGDWDEAIANQAKVLDKIIRKYAGGVPKTVLDCACGIGTQAIGLAQTGYTVTASDLSPLSIKRAGVEALKRNISINFEVADFLQLESQVEGTFDVVICCDNPLPHLLTEHELQLAAKNILSKMKPGGLFITSTRDYDEILKNKPLTTYPIVADTNGAKTFTFQTWDWLENNIYTLNHYVVTGTPGNFSTSLRKATYHAYRRTQIDPIFKQQGYTGLKWLMPTESKYFQPILLAFKP